VQTFFLEYKELNPAIMSRPYSCRALRPEMNSSTSFTCFHLIVIADIASYILYTDLPRQFV
jgi:hypothetical protein